MLIPSSVIKFFWGDNLDDLSFEKHSRYITETLLEKGDSSALKWLFSIQSPMKIRAELTNLKLSRKSVNFWQIYLS